MPVFQIQETDGSLSSVSHKEFFEILNDGCGFLYFKRGGRHIALQPTATNEETLRICRQADNAENYIHAMETRCRDEKGCICRYQRDDNGGIIRNASGKLNADLLNKLYEDAQTKAIESDLKVKSLEERIEECEEKRGSLSDQYDSMRSWADLYGDCDMETKKMILSRIMSSIRVSRDYEIEIDLTVDCEELGISC